MNKYLNGLAEYVFWYPLIMSLIWIAGSQIYQLKRTSKNKLNFDEITWPPVSILIPCFKI